MKKIHESRFEPKNLKQHVIIHKDDFKHDYRFSRAKNDDQFAKLYDDISDRLSRRYVGKSDGSDGSRYIGYITKDGRKIKYDRRTLDFVVYSKDKTITLHKKSYREYQRILKRDYYREFPYNEDEVQENEAG